MDNKTKEKLIIVMEECSEITQACSKSIRFGLTSCHPDKAITNRYEIVKEFYQLQAMIEDLQSEGAIPELTTNEINEIKKDKLKKVKKFMKKEKSRVKQYLEARIKIKEDK